MGLLKKIKKAINRVRGLQVYTAHSEYIINSVLEQKKLDNKIAIVTGGSGELGRAIAVKLASEGAKVYIGGRNEERTKSVAEELNKINLNTEPLIIDVTSQDSIQAAFSKVISNEGRIDILVNCAGGSTRSKNAKLIEQSVEFIDEMLTTNLRGSILCSREACKHMIKRESGKIVNISSIIGLFGKPNFTDYASSKAGVIGFTKSLATEMGEFGVNVNCVSPGYIQRGVYTEEKLPYLLRTTYLNRVGKPEDIANAVLFFATSDSDFITGQNLCVDGGRSLGLKGDT